MGDIKEHEMQLEEMQNGRLEFEPIRVLVTYNDTHNSLTTKPVHINPPSKPVITPCKPSEV